MAYCRWVDFIPASILATATFVGVAMFTLAPMAEAALDGSEQVAVIFPPWVDLTEGVARVATAGGRPVRAGRLDSVIIVQPDDRQFIDQVHDQGAWFVVDPQFLGGCFALGFNGPRG